METLSMEIIHGRCAGIDIGSRFHLVAVDQEVAHVKKFKVYTADHQQMIGYLQQHHITSVAMESTGSYWQTLFDALQTAGFEVLLVNGNQVKNVKGKKTDVQDCLWIQKLHALGLLRGSFMPTAELQMLRTYYGHRQYLIKQSSKYINKMQKALRLMNIRLDVVVNDIMGQSGRVMIEALLAGERETSQLASLANYRVKKSPAEIAQALAGNYREDLLFELRACLSLYDTYQQKLQECDTLLASKLAALAASYPKPAAHPATDKSGKQRTKYSPTVAIRDIASQYFGVDVMAIEGVSYNTTLCLLTQVGNDIYKFATSKHFVSWLRLAPNNKISGGKVLSSRTPKGKNRLALALRQAANSIGNQKKGPLSQFFKKIAFKKDRASAITATARKLATILFQMIVNKEEYRPGTPPTLSIKTKNKIIVNMKQKVKRLNLTEEQIKFLFLDNSLSNTL